MEDDPFTEVLGVEDQFYDEGYDLGVKDGHRAGLIEGRLFGLDKGFDKYVSCGIMHGQAIVWASRLPKSLKSRRSYDMKSKSDSIAVSPRGSNEPVSSSQQEAHGAMDGPLPRLPNVGRLEKHVRTLYALVEPSSLSTENDEAAVSEFDDRLKRAEGKVKVIEKAAGESKPSNFKTPGLSDDHVRTGYDGIEDISSMNSKH